MVYLWAYGVWSSIPQWWSATWQLYESKHGPWMVAESCTSWSMAIPGSDWLEVPIPYIRPKNKAYVRGYPSKIRPKIWYSTSILGSWNSHWVDRWWKSLYSESFFPILLVMQDFATIHSLSHEQYLHHPPPIKLASIVPNQPPVINYISICLIVITLYMIVPIKWPNISADSLQNSYILDTPWTCQHQNYWWCVLWYCH